MTAGNQGKAWDDARDALKLDPGNADLKAEEARTKAALNTSLTNAGQAPKA